ncbi:hypothetical protein ACLOJK_038276 [Asimina triloba]
MADDNDLISMTDQCRGRRDRRAANDDSNVRFETQSSTTVRWRIFSGQKTGDDVLFENPSSPHQICKPSHSKSIDPFPIDVFLKTGHGCRLNQPPLSFQNHGHNNSIRPATARPLQSPVARPDQSALIFISTIISSAHCSILAVNIQSDPSPKVRSSTTRGRYLPKINGNNPIMGKPTSHPDGHLAKQ